METNARFYSLSFGNIKTYLFAFLFIAGNILLPQLCHLIPAGGPTLLPIYFFTLIAAYKYGFRVGLLTALLSPVINHLLFGMPATSVLLPILIKSTLLAGAAAMTAHYTQKQLLRPCLSLFWLISSSVLLLNGLCAEIFTSLFRTFVWESQEC